MATAVTSLFAVRILGAVDWDATIFTAFGAKATPTRIYAEDRLGEVYLRTNQGHDGKYFFVQSNDPWLIHPSENAKVLDLPIYRSQRMFYPVLAGGAGFFTPEMIVWAMLIVNLLAIGVGTTATGQIAIEMGGSPWWGLAFLFNLGIFSVLLIGGAGIVAAAAAFGAVAFFLQGRTRLAIVLLLVAALSREAMVVTAVGSAYWLWKRGLKTEAKLAIAIPVMGVAIWAIFLRVRIGADDGTQQVQGVGLPFLGFWKAISSWIDSPIDLVVGFAILLLLLAFTWRVITEDHLVGWAFVGFVPLGLLFTEQVWRSYLDIARVTAPVLTAFVLLAVFSDQRENSRPRTAANG